MSGTTIKKRLYVYGVLTKDSDVTQPVFRFKEHSIPGQFLLESGIKNWEEFFLMNPRAEKYRQNVTIFEAEVAEGTRKLVYVTEGQFASPGSYRKPVALSDGTTDEELLPSSPRPLDYYREPAPTSIPEVAEMLRETLSIQKESYSEQLQVLKDLLQDKDNYIRSLQTLQEQKIEAATQMHRNRIAELEQQLNNANGQLAEAKEVSSNLRAEVEKLQWQQKEAVSIEKKLQKDFDEAQAALNKQGLNDGPSDFLGQLLNRPLPELIQGAIALKEMLTGSGGGGQQPMTPEQARQYQDHLAKMARDQGIHPTQQMPVQQQAPMPQQQRPVQQQHSVQPAMPPMVPPAAQNGTMKFANVETVE